MTASSLREAKKSRDIRTGMAERRRPNPADDIGVRSKYFDHHFKTTVHKIHEGDFCVLSKTDHVIMTTLGSCISVCMTDPVVKVGGRNHFLLFSDRSENGTNGYSMRYGNNAMETLFNEILKRGGIKERLIIKAFGAGNVLNINANIGAKNEAFLKKYIQDEEMKLDTCDLGGNMPRRVAFFPSTGKVFVKHLQRAGDRMIAKEEEHFRKKIEQQPVSGDIELF